ncbi:MAG: hypothetical protein HY876_02630 [Coriobacteriales bacterium]|nr:hypothetical protein [Coriobacteriales bacterium]
MTVAEDVRYLYPAMIQGDAGVVGAFGARATVDSPLGRKQEPPEFVAETRAWLERHDAASEEIRTTETDERVVHELSLRLAFEGETRELPIMLIADKEDECIRDLRIYHSTWPLTGSHSVRPPLMDYTTGERPAEPVGTYHAALAAGDAELADSLFEPEGSVREPAGSAYAHAGAERTQWYRSILRLGPIVLHLGTITDDGETVVYEFMVDRWGATQLPQQAGAAAYTRGPSGKLASARIYDDVDPPAELME